MTTMKTPVSPAFFFDSIADLFAYLRKSKMPRCRRQCDLQFG
ncbi:hypothetical protein C943_00096 [Mariniradius saccharolyticus AK6]|uniref:Uncharacterized protein n=1 Tax=Mariniradius saccharolyticus AK6 TaxID=1239962 RepID=M7XLH4_9BACT|nr:hypothetical protein C943_00096 [Mariniradius saccharolyticus AK6]